MNICFTMCIHNVCIQMDHWELLVKWLVTFSNVCMISIRICDSAERKDFIRICTVSSYDLPIILPNFSYMHPTQHIAALKKKDAYNDIFCYKILINKIIYAERLRKSKKMATYNFVGRKLGESSLFLRISLHLLTVSKSKNVSPTLNKVARHLAMRRRVGGPGAPCICLVSCSTSFCWHPLISLCKWSFSWLILCFISMAKICPYRMNFHRIYYRCQMSKIVKW